MNVKRKQWLAGEAILLGGLLLSQLATFDPLSVKSTLLTVGVAGVAIGGSIVAALFATSFYSRHVFGLDLAEAAEALRGSSAFSRANQVVEITLTKVGSEIHVEAVHDFDLFARVRHAGMQPFSLFTDLGSAGTGGGFLSVRGPDGTPVSGAELVKLTHREGGKVVFTKEFLLGPRTAGHFHIVTQGIYQLSGRLVWTVEHVSSDFKLRILDRAGLGENLAVKINHHRAAQAPDQKDPRPGCTEHFIQFPSEVLPFQGFELMWTSLESATDDAQRDLAGRGNHPSARRSETPQVVPNR